jgi:Fe-S-cluster containining protein
LNSLNDLKRIAIDEKQKVKTSLGVTGFNKTVKQFFIRLDSALEIANSQTEKKPACAAGCAYCCNIKVEVSAQEVFVIKDYVLNNFAREKIQRVIAKALVNSEESKSITKEEQLAINQECAFLEEGKCSVYEVRPGKCRSYNSHDVSNCKDSYDNPSDLTSPHTYVEDSKAIGDVMGFAFSLAFIEEGYDGHAYDLSAAFVESMRAPDSLTKWKKKKRRVFRTAKGIQWSEGN